jgi:hypothetical protein
VKGNSGVEEPKTLIELLKSADKLVASEVQETSNNPYHIPNKKEKIKVISNKIKERMSFKIKMMFDKKSKGSQQNSDNLTETSIVEESNQSSLDG